MRIARRSGVWRMYFPPNAIDIEFEFVRSRLSPTNHPTATRAQRGKRGHYARVREVWTLANPPVKTNSWLIELRCVRSPFSPLHPGTGIAANVQCAQLTWAYGSGSGEHGARPSAETVTPTPTIIDRVAICQFVDFIYDLPYVACDV
jgi:hypothetical protein